ncbi:MAG: SurA N-terminal domain-containing protein [Endomicrobium sp.]|jgi:hypothetical protein|nr:SurA N-terminal domain-containing protein [Endomicrobium sp.]
MMNFLRKHKNIIFVITIAAFISSFLPNLFYPKNYVAKVNGVKIPLKILNSITKSIKTETNKKLTEKDLNEIQTRAINLLVENEIFYQQSKSYGIIVTDKELKTYLHNSEIFKNNNIFDKQKYHSFLKYIQLTPKEYEVFTRKQICKDKLKIIILNSIKLWNYELTNSPKQNFPAMKNNLARKKAHLILDDWYSNILKNCKIRIVNEELTRPRLDL